MSFCSALPVSPEAIQWLDLAYAVEIQNKIDQKTKPLGALGQLEALALQLALIQREARITITNPMMLVFAADHGIAEHGVSIAGSEVTAQMVQNFLVGGAAINAFCMSNNVALRVVDAGMKHPLLNHDPRLILQSVGLGTQDISIHDAMTEGELAQCLQAGYDVAIRHIDDGSNVLGFGEMGIANTSSASAIASVLLDIPAAACVGRGTGISDEQLTLKRGLVEKAVARVKDKHPLQVLKSLGGFEIAQIVGAMLACGVRKTVIVVDGAIVTSAAMLVCEIAPAIRDYMVFAHQSEEAIHRAMLQHLNADPLLKLGMRLGEGSGAAIAMSLLRSAASFYNEMATFEQANVTVG